MISKAAQRVLKLMVAADKAGDYLDAELVCSGRDAYVGLHSTSRAVVNELLRMVLVRDAGEHGIANGLERYTVNSDGRKAAEDPTYINSALRDLYAATQEGHQK